MYLYRRKITLSVANYVLQNHLKPTVLHKSVVQGNSKPIMIRFQSMEHPKEAVEQREQMKTDSRNSFKFPQQFASIPKGVDHAGHTGGTASADGSESVLKDSILKTLSFVEQISHMDDVRKSQAKVMEIKDQLKQAGDRKREILRRMNDVRNGIQKNHGEICSSLRGTERYVQLVQEELVLLQKEKQIQTEFETTDDSESQLFSSLTTAINDSYEKEKMHANLLRVWALIGTLVASIVTLIASFIGHYYHNTKFGTLRDTLRLDFKDELEKQEKLIRKQFNMELKDQESWGGYFKRHGNTVYRWITWR